MLVLVELHGFEACGENEQRLDGAENACWIKHVAVTHAEPDGQWTPGGCFTGAISSKRAAPIPPAAQPVSGFRQHFTFIAKSARKADASPDKLHVATLFIRSLLPRRAKKASKHPRNDNVDGWE